MSHLARSDILSLTDDGSDEDRPSSARAQTGPAEPAGNFLQAYRKEFDRIEGWFQFDAAILFMALVSAGREHGLSGDMLEIGVHKGLSAIAAGSMLRECEKLWAVDLFERQQELNTSRSGGGHRGEFERNMSRVLPGAPVCVLEKLSLDVTVDELGGAGALCFCHIDGGHSRTETFLDLSLCCEALCPGGLVALDDYFHPWYPGVVEGALHFMMQRPSELQPVAIGYNKVILQKPGDWDARRELTRAWPNVPFDVVKLWDRDTPLFSCALGEHFDLGRSTPHRLAAR